MNDESICECPYCNKTVVVVSETADPADTKIKPIGEVTLAEED